MKEVSKLKKIYTGFFGENVPEDIAKDRRAACAVCPYNSINAEKLSLIGSVRNKLAAPFCTLCSCQIHEKTSSALEECAMYMIGEEKKWYKIKIETMENTSLNLIQTGENKYDIQIVEDDFVVNVGKVDPQVDVYSELLFQIDKGNTISFVNTEVPCGCTSSKTTQVDGQNIESRVRIDVAKIGMGAQTKTITLNYKMNGESKSQKVKFKMFRVK